MLARKGAATAGVGREGAVFIGTRRGECNSPNICARIEALHADLSRVRTAFGANPWHAKWGLAFPTLNLKGRAGTSDALQSLEASAGCADI
jgi:hypothetical protein